MLSASHAQAACPGADSAVPQLTPSQAQVALLCLSNEARGAVGQPAFKADERLHLAATRHAEDMTSRDYFDHVAPAPAPYGRDIGARASAADYPFRSLGENLASGQATPRAAVQAWLRSPGHCANLLDPMFDEVGLSRAASAPTWVQVLGTRSGNRPSAPYTGCGGQPPSVANVAGGPPSDVAPAAPKSTGVKVVGVQRKRGEWIVKLRGARADGRVATTGLYAARRQCSTAKGGSTSCQSVPGKRLRARNVTLDATTTARLRTARSAAYLRITLKAFSRDGVRYAATSVVRKLPR